MVGTQDISFRAGSVRSAPMSDQSGGAAVNGNTEVLKVLSRARLIPHYLMPPHYPSCEQPLEGVTVTERTLPPCPLSSSLFGRKQC